MPESSELEYTSEERFLFALLTGFLRSKLLSVAVEADLFTWLWGHPRSFDEVREHLQFPERSARAFLSALVTVGLLRLENGRYENSKLARKYLRRGRIVYAGDIVKLMDDVYDSCSNLGEVLRNGEPNNRLYSYFFGGDVGERLGHDHLHNTCRHPAMVLHEYVDFSDVRRVLDLGGGYGRACMTLVSQFEDIETILFDLPEVCAHAERELSNFWLSDRIRVLPGDFFEDEFPSGVDMVLMMRIAQDWSSERVMLLFRKAFDALESRGRIVIYETLEEDDASAPGDAALVSLLLLMTSPQGRCRSPGELSRMLAETGFVKIQVQHVIQIYKVVVAEKPGEIAEADTAGRQAPYRR